MRSVLVVVLLAQLALLVACRGREEPPSAPPPSPPAAPAPIPAATPRPVSIAIEDGTVLVLLDDGTLRGWGRGRRGMLGEPHGADRATPMKLPWAHDLSALVVGGWKACAHASAAGWWCWGRDRAPAIDPNLTDAKSIVLGANFGCALRANGTVGCWGFAPGHYASSIFETKLRPASPRKFADVPELHDVTALASSGDHVCAVEADGTVWCWGSDARGQVSGTALAFDHDRVVDKPTKVAGVAHAVDVAVTSEQTCVHVGGSTWCWGEGHDGPEERHALGPFVPGNDFAICERSGAGIQCGLDEPVHAHALARDLETTCTIDDDDIVRCARDNRVGELGDGTLVSRTEPKPVVDLVAGRGAPLPAPQDPPGARATAWDSAPCKHDATLQFSVHDFATTPFEVRSAFARNKTDMLVIDISDHLVALDDVDGTPKPAGDQRTIQLLFANYSAKTDFLALVPGRYALRHPGPGKAGEVHVWGTSAYATNIDEKPDFTGTLTLDRFSDGWACGAIDVTGPGGTIRGRFAAELLD
ncbi:MAG: hypothetical protein ABJE66_15075 [Deltaproteobacteria bacterium]